MSPPANAGTGASIAAATAAYMSFVTTIELPFAPDDDCCRISAATTAAFYDDYPLRIPSPRRKGAQNRRWFFD